MGRASKIYKDNSSPEEVEEILKEQTLNLENYNAGVIICNWKDNEKGFDCHCSVRERLKNLKPSRLRIFFPF